MKEKIKSYSFWTALSGAVVVLLQAIGKCFGFSINSDLVSGLIMAVAGILVVLGIVSMPNKDDESQNANDEDKKEQSDESVNDNNNETNI